MSHQWLLFIFVDFFLSMHQIKSNFVHILKDFGDGPTAKIQYTSPQTMSCFYFIQFCSCAFYCVKKIHTT